MSEIKERPILFSAPMVRAILEGRKTVTRREVKKRAALDCLAAGFEPAFLALPGNADLCPYGKPGDRVRVKETFYAFGRWETRFSQKKGRDEWHFVDMTTEQFKAYQFEPPQKYRLGQRSEAVPTWWKRPAIFMPRIASRILLEITEVRVERLQGISEKQALAEGIVGVAFRPDDGWPICTGYMVGPDDGKTGLQTTAAKAFAGLWDSVGGDWATNPWVWVVEFKQVTP